MNREFKKSLVERVCESIGLLTPLQEESPTLSPLETPNSEFSKYPPEDQWDDWVEYDASSWPKRKKKNYSVIPTTCFNCESACGLLAYVDKKSGSIQRFEGNPYHVGSRGRNCAKGPATINQIHDPERVLYPLKRKGERGSGQWERVSWEEALDDIAAKMNRSLKKSKTGVVYHVGRPGHAGYAERVVKAWGIDGHNSHTNVCSSGARVGYTLWQHYDRPSPDFANASTVLLISAHLESGHYFNPHAQRIMDSMMNGAKLIVMDPRLSNTASMADIWLPTYPGTEPVVLLAIANYIIQEGKYHRHFIENWVNWQDFLGAKAPSQAIQFENFIEQLKDEYKEFTLEFAAQESGVQTEKIREAAEYIANSGTRLAAHNWRSAGSGNLGGWQVSRCLHFLNVLTGSVGTKGGTSPSGWNKYHPAEFDTPPGPKVWNELHYPKEFPLAYHEMSILLPHFLKEGRGELDVYFTRVFNPVWTYPDGFSWIEVLRDESLIKCHVALTPTWNETAYWADYVLPMGHASERHDLTSYETHNGVWISFRQPVLKEYARRQGKAPQFTYEANPGEVWEEDEFWIELSWKADPDESLGIRKHFKSPYRDGEKITIDEYYQYTFDRVPGLKEAAARKNLSALDYMKRFGTFEILSEVYEKHLTPLSEEQLNGSTVNENGQVVKAGKIIGVMENGVACVGFPTPSKKQEFYSQTMKDWKWPEYTIPGYIKSHIHPDKLDRNKNEFVLVPTFRLPNLIHSRSANAKWLVEIAHRNPIWIHPSTAEKVGVKQTGDLIKVHTDIGYFIDKVWITESMKPNVIGCSHHIGRWKRPQDQSGNSWAVNTVSIEEKENGQWKMSTQTPILPFDSADKDSKRIWWRDGGVHQNITFPVHPDPISGMHCWHQKVRLTLLDSGDQYGDIFVDTQKSHEVYKEWMAQTRPAPGPDGLRRPLWFARVLKPAQEAYYIDED